MFVDRLRKWASARGYRVATAPIELLDVVRRKLEGRRESGMIEPGFFAKNLSGFRYLSGSSLGGPRMLVVVAVPSQVSILPLTLRGKRIDGLIPPTYVQYKKTFEDVLADMKANVLGTEIDTTGAEILSAPLKSLAVHMGLVSYGRNNVTYAPGLGSGHQLCGYVVGMRDGVPERSGGSAAGRKKGQPVGDRASSEVRGCGQASEWSETSMDRCSSCRACLEACPTGAIREDRFLISAERCYTLYSESKDRVPGWVRPPKSLCLIGCLACQEVCPENKGLLRCKASGEEFTGAETDAVLDIGRRLAAGEEIGGRAGNEEGAKESERDKGKGEIGAKKRRAAIDSGKHRRIVDRGSGRLASESARDKLGRLGMSEDIEVIARNLWISLDQRGLVARPG